MMRLADTAERTDRASQIHMIARHEQPAAPYGGTGGSPRQSASSARRPDRPRTARAVVLGAVDGEEHRIGFARGGPVARRHVGERPSSHRSARQDSHVAARKRPICQSSSTVGIVVWSRILMEFAHGSALSLGVAPAVITALSALRLNRWGVLQAFPFPWLVGPERDPPHSHELVRCDRELAHALSGRVKHRIRHRRRDARRAQLADALRAQGLACASNSSTKWIWMSPGMSAFTGMATPARFFESQRPSVGS